MINLIRTLSSKFKIQKLQFLFQFYTSIQFFILISLQFFISDYY